MALKSMSIQHAMEIYNIYSDILGDQDRESYGKYFPYSALKGYDVTDVDNAIKIFLANQVYNRTLNNADIDRLSDWGDTGIALFTLTFIPDEYTYELDKYDRETIEFKIKYHELTTLALSPPFGMYKIFVEERKELASSFLKYCLTLNKSGSDFWNKVFDRLGIEFISEVDKFIPEASKMVKWYKGWDTKKVVILYIIIWIIIILIFSIL